MSARGNGWTSSNNGAEFGADYYTRLAVARTKIFAVTGRQLQVFASPGRGDDWSKIAECKRGAAEATPR